MGARLYNPVTNQFTSPDPVTGGNETTYTYPNDPINKNDITGLDAALSMVISLISSLLIAFVCATTALLGCLLGGAIVSGVAQAIEEGMEMYARKGSEKQVRNAMAHGFVVGAGEGLAFGFIGGPLLRFVSKFKIFTKWTKPRPKIKKEPNMKAVLSSTQNSTAADYAWDKTKKTYGWNW
jgi:hypothetical protein